MCLPKAVLQGVQIVRAGVQTLDGRHLPAIRLHGEEQAGADGFTVEEYGAGAADAVLAADVRARQAQVVAQEIAQQQARLDFALIRAAIYRKGDRMLQGSGPHATR